MIGNRFFDALEKRTFLSAALQWQTEAPLPVGKAEGAAFVADGKLFTFGGFFNAKFELTPELDAYDPVANKWIREADCPVKVNDCPVALDPVTDVAWIGGFFINDGFHASRLVYSYNVKTNQWTQGPSLPLDIGAGGMAVVGRTLHYFGGRSASNVGTTAQWDLNLDDTSAGWTADTPMLMTANHNATAVLGGKIYSMGGIVNKEETTSNETKVQVYDPATKEWTLAAPLPFGLGHVASSATVAGDKIILVGGQMNGSGQVFSKSVLEYDASANKWTQLTDLPDNRASAFAGYIDGKLVVTAGNVYHAPFASVTTIAANFDPGSGGQSTTMVSGIVFNDANGNGTLDGGEGGLASVTVYSDQNNNGKLDSGEASAITDSGGGYTLTGLPNGATVLRQILPDGATQTFPSRGFGQHVNVGSSAISGVNFGDVFGSSSSNILVSGVVFNDANSSGKQDAGEGGLSGWTVYADVNNDGMLDNGEANAITDAGGNFSFTNLSAGAYIFRAIRPAGWQQTSPANGFGWHVTVKSGTATTIRFGEHQGA